MRTAERTDPVTKGHAGTAEHPGDELTKSSLEEEVDRFFRGNPPEAPAEEFELRDPFAGVSDFPHLVFPAPGQTTDSFVRQARIPQTRAPWRLAILIGLLVAIVLVGIAGVISIANLGIGAGQSPVQGAAPHVFTGPRDDASLRQRLLGDKLRDLPKDPK